MNESEVVLRLDAKLAAIDRQAGRAILTFLVRDDDALVDLTKAVGAECMLGVLVEPEQLPIPKP